MLWKQQTSVLRSCVSILASFSSGVARAWTAHDIFAASILLQARRAVGHEGEGSGAAAQQIDGLADGAAAQHEGARHVRDAAARGGL
jgi:hypothetical protein